MTDKNQSNLESPASLVGLVPSITGAVIAVSVVIGAGSLFGKLAAIGSYALEFVTAADLIDAATRTAPISLVFLCGFGWLRIVTDSREGRSRPQKAFPKWSYFILPLVCALGAIAFYTLPPSKGSGPVWICAFIGISALIKITDFEIDKGRLHVSILVLGFLFSLFVGAFLTRYFTTVQELWTENPTFSLNENTICDAINCRSGTIVTRLSQVTIIRWRGETTLDYIPNSFITKVSIVKPFDDEPIFDLWGHLGRWLRL
ncbi:hypothetical protein RHIZO_02083 [Rhizobiaceae bacterium]|nr:hypothetical protein RHIZO_02083 [Rhizobiaceae bacterium]